MSESIIFNNYMYNIYITYYIASNILNGSLNVFMKSIRERPSSL